MSNYKIIDSHFGQNEIIISQEKELRDILENMLSQMTRIVLLISPEAGILTLGIGEPYGFVEHMNEDGNLPYLIATQNTPSKEADYFVEFDSGGTSTPIHVSKCLPINTVIEIAAYFFRNNELPKFVNWEQV